MERISHRPKRSGQYKRNHAGTQPHFATPNFISIPPHLNIYSRTRARTTIADSWKSHYSESGGSQRSRITQWAPEGDTTPHLNKWLLRNQPACRLQTKCLEYHRGSQPATSPPALHNVGPTESARYNLSDFPLNISWKPDINLFTNTRKRTECKPIRNIQSIFKNYKDTSMC